MNNEFLNAPLNLEDLENLENLDFIYINYENEIKNIISILISDIVSYLFNIKDIAKLKNEIVKRIKIINQCKLSLNLQKPQINTKLLNKLLIESNDAINITMLDNKFIFIVHSINPKPLSETITNKVQNFNTKYENLCNDKKIYDNVKSLFNILSNLQLIITSGTDKHKELIGILDNIYNNLNKSTPKTDGKRYKSKRKSKRRSKHRRSRLVNAKNLYHNI